eukprot:CAMPEP_0201738550 /NCGR_PEP_ID=MMETSP0593-20130828/45310_1 /ASSEMBLY_ACC=CAM_ASM_000672 /TAXON_ID=267983 /ORGANISM="Skeletonema japonicum, Strain CCMP2506" /LENGTH=68 /DNA_ID=CAMNT_0048232771 /DNA_START=101 /DNA_END=307 /DNA_ORIENTATION=+
MREATPGRLSQYARGGERRRLDLRNGKKGGIAETGSPLTLRQGMGGERTTRNKGTMDPQKREGRAESE